jgi:hypothetical protein
MAVVKWVQLMGHAVDEGRHAGKAFYKMDWSELQHLPRQGHGREREGGGAAAPLETSGLHK